MKTNIDIFYIIKPTSELVWKPITDFSKETESSICSAGDLEVVQVFNRKTLEMVQHVETEYGNNTIAFDENPHEPYILPPKSHSVGVYQY